MLLSNYYDSSGLTFVLYSTLSRSLSERITYLMKSDVIVFDERMFYVYGFFFEIHQSISDVLHRKGKCVLCANYVPEYSISFLHQAVEH